MTTTLAIVATGEMGSAVGAAYVRAGYRVLSDLSERSAASRERAASAGIEDAGSLTALLGTAEIVLSIVPPAAAVDFARSAAAALPAAGPRPVLVDCNAVAPATVRSIAALWRDAGGVFVDAGIVGPAPRAGTPAPTRVYVSGEARARVLALATPELRMIDMGPETGRASAIKMAYAAMNKGVDALYTAVLMAAERLGVREELMEEFRGSQTREAERMAARLPYLAATAERYTGEMREIAATFAAAGVTDGFHRGAEWVYAALARTPLAEETRATLPAHRPLDEAIRAFCGVLGEP